MKEGWEYKKLGEVCEKISDGSHNPPKGVVMSRNIMLSSQNIQNDSLDMTKVRFISDEDFLIENQRTQVKKGDVLLTIVGTIGRTCVLNGTEGNITFQRSVAVLKPSKEITSRFLMYFLLSQNSALNATAQGAAQKGIYLKQLGNFGISYPPLSEQQRIVDYLDAAFAKIDATKANAEKSLNEAKALFQASLKEMLEPKEGWEEKKVGDISEIKGGKRLPKGEKLQSEPTSHKYIRVADFNEYGTVNLDDILYISDNVYEHIKRYIIKKEDIYISIAGTIGKSGIIPEELDGANLTENACRLILSKEINQRFMYYITISPEFIRQEIESTKISAQPKLALTRLSDIIITFPPLSEQQSIVVTLDSLKSKVDRLQENYDKISQECDALKQAILRKVFE